MMLFATLVGITVAVMGLFIEALRVADGGGVLVIVGVLTLLVSSARP